MSIERPTRLSISLSSIFIKIKPFSMMKDRAVEKSRIYINSHNAIKQSTVYIFMHDDQKKLNLFRDYATLINSQFYPNPRRVRAPVSDSLHDTRNYAGIF